MTPSEFKAWLDGFSEAIDGRPTAAQWARIQEQVKKLNAAPVYGTNGPFAPHRFSPNVQPNIGWPLTAGSPPSYTTGAFSVADPDYYAHLQN